ncbi:N-acetylmuramoyl-L-alanine amidase [Oceanobacillus caeni]
MAYKIVKNIIPGLTQRNLTASNFIVAHESGNKNNTGSNSLDNEVRFMSRNWKSAFVSHWVGGGGRIVQLAEVGKLQYGAGPKANPYAYAHVELARTNNIETFKKDYAAYVWLLRKLANDAGIPIKLDTGSRVTDKGIKSHDWIRKHLGGTTHTDPYTYLASFGISRAQFKKDIEKGTVSSPVKVTNKPAPKKSIDQLADEVIAGKHGSGAQRKKSLGSQYDAVQKRVNEKLGANPKPKQKSKSIDTLVKETLASKHGNGETRKKSLGKNYKAVMDVINGKSSSKPKSGKSVSQMASMIIYDPKAPKGHENRRKWLGISKAEYEKVRIEVNKRF